MLSSNTIYLLYVILVSIFKHLFYKPILLYTNYKYIYLLFFYSAYTSLDNNSLYSSLYPDTENTNMLFRSVPKTVNYKITKKNRVDFLYSPIKKRKPNKYINTRISFELRTNSFLLLLLLLYFRANSELHKHYFI